MALTLGKVAGWCGGRLTKDDVNREVKGFCTDSRQLKAGELFFALRGPNFDGHDFAAAALKAGAAAVVVEREDCLGGGLGVVVKDALRALGDVAHRHRWEENLIPWIGVTGSNGKTTTKELLRTILSARGIVAVSQGNFNNLIGLPLSILRRPREAWIGVVELGASVPGEIERLAAIASPTVSIITSIGHSHLQGFGDRQNVAHEKADIYRGLPADGLAIFPAGAPHLDVVMGHIQGRRASFGVETKADLEARDVETGPDGVRFTARGVKFELPLLGRHNIGNCLAALLAAERFGIGLEEAARALKSVKPVHERLEIIQTRYFTILNDVYNANPSSLEAAVEVMDAFKGRRRMVVVGDMLELGKDSRSLHYEAGRMLARKGIEVVIAVGKESVVLAEGASTSSAKNIVRHFPSVNILLSRRERLARTGDVVLVKGSRGMRMEQIIDELMVWEPE